MCDSPSKEETGPTARADSTNLRGYAAIITGGGQGIGRALAIGLAGMGADVAVVARTVDDVRATAGAARAAGARALALQADVSVRAEIEQAVGCVVRDFGRLDILIAAAGIYGPIGTVLENDPFAWEETIRINLLGTFYSIRAVLPIMMKQQRGKIISFSGGGAVSPRPRFSAYATSKTAVVRLTETVAAEFASYQIDVNAIAPGPIPTRLHDHVLRNASYAGDAEVRKAREIMESGRGSMDRLLGLVSFLVSEESDGLTGRLISAVWDDWENLRGRIAEIRDSDLYTMRRVVG